MNTVSHFVFILSGLASIATWCQLWRLQRKRILVQELFYPAVGMYNSHMDSI